MPDTRTRGRYRRPFLVRWRDERDEEATHVERNDGSVVCVDHQCRPGRHARAES